MSPRQVDPGRFPIRPEGFVGWDGAVHVGFGYAFDEASAFTWCGVRVDELPPERVPADDAPDRISCDRCRASLMLAARLVDGVEQGATQAVDLFALSLAYGAAMAAVMGAGDGD